MKNFLSIFSISGCGVAKPCIDNPIIYGLKDCQCKSNSCNVNPSCEIATLSLKLMDTYIDHADVVLFNIIISLISGTYCNML